MELSGWAIAIRVVSFLLFYFLFLVPQILGLKFVIYYVVLDSFYSLNNIIFCFFG